MIRLALIFSGLLFFACTKKASQTVSEQPTQPSVQQTTNNGAAKASPAAAEVIEMKGLFSSDKGKLELVPCDAPTANYWVLGDTEVLEEQYQAAILQGYEGQNVVVHLKGFVRPMAKPRGAAQASPYTGQFEVTEVLQVRPKNKRNTCISWDYWASGNEPFWDLQISEAEGVMELNLVGKETVRFDYRTPTIEQGGKLIRYYSAGTKQRIKVRITAEECIDDMAGNRSTHSVEVDYAGKTLKGCAVVGS